MNTLFPVVCSLDVCGKCILVEVLLVSIVVSILFWVGYFFCSVFSKIEAHQYEIEALSLRSKIGSSGLLFKKIW